MPEVGINLGPDRAGNMLEVVTVHFDDAGVPAIHAIHVMRMTKQYWRLLEGHRNG